MVIITKCVYSMNTTLRNIQILMPWFLFKQHQNLNSQCISSRHLRQFSSSYTSPSWNTNGPHSSASGYWHRPTKTGFWWRAPCTWCRTDPPGRASAWPRPPKRRWGVRRGTIGSRARWESCRRVRVWWGKISGIFWKNSAKNHFQHGKNCNFHCKPILLRIVHEKFKHFWLTSLSYCSFMNTQRVFLVQNRHIAVIETPSVKKQFQLKIMFQIMFKII